MSDLEPGAVFGDAAPREAWDDFHFRLKTGRTLDCELHLGPMDQEELAALARPFLRRVREGVHSDLELKPEARHLYMLKIVPRVVRNWRGYNGGKAMPGPHCISCSHPRLLQKLARLYGVQRCECGDSAQVEMRETAYSPKMAALIFHNLNLLSPSDQDEPLKQILDACAVLASGVGEEADDEDRRPS